MTTINSALFNPGWQEKLGIGYSDLVLPDTGEHLTKERFDEMHGSSKTQGVLIPQALHWEGPLVSAPTKPDVIEATSRSRGALAAEHGGSVMLWAPTTAAAPSAAVQPTGWTPLAGCDAVETCEWRVRALVAASGAGVGARRGGHPWVRGADVDARLQCP